MRFLAINLPVDLVKSINILWKGMLTIFIGIGIIYLIILLLSKVKDKVASKE